MSDIKVNQLAQAQSITDQTQLLALTNFDENIVSLITLSTVLSNIVSDSDTNALGYNEGLLYVDNKYPQSVNTLNGSGTVTLETNTINRIEITGDISITLPTPTTGIFNQILIQVSMPTAYSVNLGTTYTFNGVLPLLSNTGNYNLIYEHDGSNWYVGIIERGLVS